MMKRTTVAIAALVISGASFAAAVEDWPKWMGPRGDNISKESVSDSAWPEAGPKKLWTKKLGGGHASPIAVGGKVYVFSLVDRKSEVLTALDTNSGEAAWSQSYDRATPKGGGSLKNADWDGTRATPTVEGDRIYTLGSTGDLTCRNLADGKQLWQINVLKEAGGENLEWGTCCSPTIEGDLLYVQGGIGEGAAIALAVDKKSGKVAWLSEARGKGNAEGDYKNIGAGYAQVVIAEVAGKKQAIVFGGRDVYGIDPATGKTLWTTPWPTQYDVNAATPIVRDGKMLITSEYQTSKGALFELKADGATKLWETKDIKSRFQPPIVEDGYIYVNSRGTLTCLKWADGSKVWEAKDKALRLGVGGTFLRVGGEKMVAMTERGKMCLAEVNPKGAKVIGPQVDVFEANNVWASPLVYDGKLYVKGGDEIIAYDLSGK